MFLLILAGSAIFGGIIATALSGSFMLGLFMLLLLGCFYGSWWYSWNR
jgi:hypothetical protein